MHANLVATYRLQMGANFTFQQAVNILDYLKGLGISHVYLSPILQSAEGSTHGYDTADPTIVNEQMGGESGLLELFSALKSRQMAAVLDIVPNHLSATQDNPFWWDVLKNGQASRYSKVFDIDWDAPANELKGKVLLPILGEELTDSINKISIIQNDRGFVFLYENLQFPVNDIAAHEIQQGETDNGKLLALQYYCLAHWTTGPSQLNYRRFFDVNTLAGVRIEDDSVFDLMHGKLAELVKRGPVDGIRVDHPDGLRDPLGYFKKLRQKFPEQWIIVEKILEEGELLRENWPVDGTSGYDFIQLTNGIWNEPSSEEAFTQFHNNFTGCGQSFPNVVREKKAHVSKLLFTTDISRLAAVLVKICSSHNLSFSEQEIQEALTAILVNFPVYRSYVHQERQEISVEDLHYISLAIENASTHNPQLSPKLLTFINDQLIGQDGKHCAEFVARFQQLTGPIMAKGVEDTAFYCYGRFIALNEVGCDPEEFSLSLKEFHLRNETTQKLWPQSMLASSTHDTKRSEDVRARLCVLSEIPEKWFALVAQWSAMNASAWGNHSPDRNAEYFIYQTLVGAWPISNERLSGYIQKALREAKRHTSWLAPDLEYEEALQQFVQSSLANNAFTTSLNEFVNFLIPYGNSNSLALTLIKLTAPGIPDIYQGTELWDNSLVDPDNRRPIDFSLRQKLLNSGRKLPSGSLLEPQNFPEAKIHLIQAALNVRRGNLQAFGALSNYQQLWAKGANSEHIIAYIRNDDVAVIVPRCLCKLQNDWADTSIDLGPAHWRNVLSPDQLPLTGKVLITQLFANFPIGLLTKIQSI